MSWPKGKRRKQDMFSNVPAYIQEYQRELGTNLGNPIVYSWSRADQLHAIEMAKIDFVESGEHIEAEQYHPGIRERAERACGAIIERDRKLKAGAARENTRKAMAAEARRQWVAKHCADFVFRRSRKRAIAEIQHSLTAAGLPVPSVSRLYADIATIRQGWRVKYFSHAKDG